MFLHGGGSYILGALVLKKSLENTGSQLPVVVAVTATVPKEHRELLTKAGCVLKEVELIHVKSNSAAYKSHFSSCYTKFQFWSWTEYDVIVYLDADMMVTRNLDHLASVPLPSVNLPIPIAAVRDVGSASANTGLSTRKWSPYYNAGLIVLRPSLQAYDHLVDRLNLVPKLSLPYAEQDLLNDYVSTNFIELPLEYNAQCDSIDSVTYSKELDLLLSPASLPAVIHYTGPKPWALNPITEQNLTDVQHVPSAERATQSAKLSTITIKKSDLATRAWWSTVLKSSLNFYPPRLQFYFLTVASCVQS